MATIKAKHLTANEIESHLLEALEREGLVNQRLAIVPKDEIERLRAIEKAGKEVLRAVDKTADHTEWFKSIGALAHAILPTAKSRQKAASHGERNTGPQSVEKSSVTG